MDDRHLPTEGLTRSVLTGSCTMLGTAQPEAQAPDRKPFGSVANPCWGSRDRMGSHAKEASCPRQGFTTEPTEIRWGSLIAFATRPARPEGLSVVGNMVVMVGNGR